MAGGLLHFNEAYVINEIDNRAVILEPTGEEVYILEDEEYHIFKLFDGIRPIDAVIKQLESDYETAGIEQDVIEFVNQLVEKGILLSNDNKDSAYLVND